jgi:hypothetical protein
MPGGHFMHREHPAIFIEKLLRVLGSPEARAFGSRRTPESMLRSAPHGR